MLEVDIQHIPFSDSISVEKPRDRDPLILPLIVPEQFTLTSFTLWVSWRSHQEQQNHQPAIKQ